MGKGGGRNRRELDVDAMLNALERLRADPAREEVILRENYGRDGEVRNTERRGGGKRRCIRVRRADPAPSVHPRPPPAVRRTSSWT